MRRCWFLPMENTRLWYNALLFSLQACVRSTFKEVEGRGERITVHEADFGAPVGL